MGVKYKMQENTLKAMLAEVKTSKSTDDVVVECSLCLEIPVMCDLTHETKLHEIDKTRANLAFRSSLSTRRFVLT